MGNNSLKRGTNHILGPWDKEAYSLLPIKDNSVLDVGACDGDSAKFFYEKGARRIYCIEMVKEFADMIKTPNTVVLNEPFQLKHLELPCDCWKFDIEGHEALLLDYKGEFKPTVIEVHSEYLYERFKEIGFRRLYEPKNNYDSVRICFMVNF
jgi:hypothetical protein